MTGKSCFFFVLLDVPKEELLPPSAFEKTSGKSGDNAWKELAEATNRIMQLQQENVELKWVQ